MSGFEVGIQGGPGDGQIVAVASGRGELGPPNPYFIPEFHRTTDGVTSRMIRYDLRVNTENEGPLWFYVRDTSAPVFAYHYLGEDTPIVQAAANPVLSGGQP